MDVRVRLSSLIRDAHARKPRVLRWLLVALMLVGFVAMLGFLVAPPVVRSVAETQVSKALGRQVSIERVRINPFGPSASIEGLRIAEAGGSGNFVAIARVDANLGLLRSIHSLAPVVESLHVERPDIRFARLADNRFSFSDILDRFATKPAVPDRGDGVHFALNNIEISGGHIEFDDRPFGLHHVVDQVSIGLPFISNIRSTVDVFVQPHLSAIVNGTELSMTGRVKPFADRREAALQIDLEPTDVLRYLGYVPGKLPFKVEHAFLTANLECVWAEQANGGNTLSLRGEAALSEVALKDARDGSDLAGWRRLQVGLSDVQPLASPMKLAFDKILLFQPDVHLRRLRDGSIKLPQSEQKPAVASSVRGPAAEASGAATAGKPVSPQISIAQMDVRGGRLHWQDDSLPEKFSTRLEPVDIRFNGFDSVGKKPATLSATVQAESTGKLSADGPVDLLRGVVDLRLALSQLKLERYRPYYAQTLGPARPAATVDAAVRLSIASGKDGYLRMNEGKLKLSALTLPEAGQKRPLVQVGELSLDGFALDADRHVVEFAQITGKDAEWHIVHDADGINLLNAFVSGNRPPVAQNEGTSASAASSLASSISTTNAAASSSVSSVSQSAAPKWAVRTGRIQLGNWNATLEERTGSEPVALVIRKLGLRTEGLSNEAGSSARLALGFGVNQRGQFRAGGTIGIAPFKGDLRLDARDVDLLFAQPYLSNYMRVLLTQGSLSARGRMDFDLGDARAPKYGWAGDVAVRDLNSFDELNETDFVRWKNLSFGKLNVRSSPLDVSAAEVKLDDFYTRLILDSQGRFNLRELFHNEDVPDAPRDNARAPRAATAGASSSSASLPFRLKLDEIAVSGGNVNFSDRFIKPNYDANLTEVAGTLRGLSSDTSTLADLSLKAKVDHSAPVEITGQLNPLRQDRMLDISARVSDIDLTGVSTYAARYVGYGISKGKLSMTARYSIRDRKLTADNQLYVDQLTFGDRIDSPTALKLPIHLAVALLKDRNGVIDLNLPVSGTLDDPQFSVGGILWRAFVNLLTKAVTSPFAMLGSLFGGGEELSFIEFDPGSSALSAAAQAKLVTLSRALNDRPALRLDITGSADPSRDAAGVKRARLDGSLRALKAAAMVRRGESVGQVDNLSITRKEYPVLLEQLYKDTKFDKPRNAIGLTKTLPVVEMEKLILDNTAVSTVDLLVLARQRAQRVHDWLTTDGKVAGSRIFVIEPEADERSRARANFSLK